MSYDVTVQTASMFVYILDKEIFKTFLEDTDPRMNDCMYNKVNLKDNEYFLQLRQEDFAPFLGFLNFCSYFIYNANELIRYK